MASYPILVLFFLSFAILALANEATVENIIELGSSLSPQGNYPSSWVSSSRHFAFGFYTQGDGYAVGIWLVGATEGDNTVVWTANRDDPPVSSSSTLQLTKDGLLLRQGKEETGPLIIASVSKAAAAAAASSASMLDSGNFVIYGNASTADVVWRSFDYPTDTILGGQNLTGGHNLTSSLSKSNHSSGRFNLIMRVNYGLDAYPRTNSPYIEDVYWSFMAAPASNASGRPITNANRGWYRRGDGPANPESVDDTPTGNGTPNTESFAVQNTSGGASLCECYSAHLSLSVEGFLCLGEFHCLANNTNQRKKSQNTTSIYRATLDSDGNFRLYEHQFESEGNATSVNQTLWEALPDVCQINGLCGFNSYCSHVTDKAVCACYPGFVPSENSGNMFLECKLKYSKNDCEISADPIALYDVKFLEEIWWGDSPYFLTPTTMEDCEKSCKEDCDCGAALYTGDGSCNKYRLPLRYGRKTSNASATALLKVPSRYLNSPSHNTSPQPEVVVDNRKSLIITLSFTLGCISLLCVLSAVYIFFIYRHQVYTYTKLFASSNLGFTEECSLRSFSFDELVKATDGFTEEVGRGSFGAVYRGTIGDNNKRIAVKRLEKIVDEGEQEFRAEIKAIARTHHRNLVKLIGYCIDGSRKLLVYEYLSNGSLANLLFKVKKHLPLKERVKIALDVARGVQYLHEECEVRIIHCNLKPQNILMDEAWTAKISDFGFARLLKPEHSRAKPGDEGKSGYFAPEWQKEASLVSVKADIYSYGVVLLEIACRRRNIEVNVSTQEEVLLSSWVYQCFATGQLNKLVACDIDEDIDLKTLERMVKVGLWCVQDDPSLRPSMKNAILMLEGWKDTPIPPSPSL